MSNLTLLFSPSFSPIQPHPCPDLAAYGFWKDSEAEINLTSKWRPRESPNEREREGRGEGLERLEAARGT